MKWSNYWRDAGESGKLPTHFFLFEDLKDVPREAMEGILTFLLDGRDIKGTYLEHRLNEATKKDSKAGELYKPRSGKVTHDTSKFTEAHLARFDELAGDNPYFYRFSDPSYRYCYWPAEE